MYQGLPDFGKRCTRATPHIERLVLNEGVGVNRVTEGRMMVWRARRPATWGIEWI
jgi:hypothetical protein